MTAVVVAGAVVVVVGGRSGAPEVAPERVVTGTVPDAEPPSADHEALVAALPEASLGDLGPARLAPGLVPPTNRWFSGTVFGTEPQPVFPLPVSVQVVDGGLTLGAPRPVTGPSSVVGPHVPVITVDVGPMTLDASRVSAYDAASLTVDLLSADEVVARVHLAQGSPFVTVVAAATVDLEVTPEPDGAATVAEPAAVVGPVRGAVRGEGRPWAAVGRLGTLDPGERLTLYPLPDDADDDALAALAAAAADPVVATELAYGVADGVAQTRLTYVTENGTDPVLVAMPHHRAHAAGGARCGLGTYPSVHGTLELCRGPELVTQVPLLRPAVTPDLSRIGPDQRAALVEQLERDVAATPDFPADTYFGGKALHRAAVLVALGRELGAEDVVAPLAERAEAELRTWAEPLGCAERDHRCVVYDPEARGVVGLVTAFGSEEFNDHHFHFGYLLGAAGVLAADDPQLAADLAPVMDALAADVAAAVGSERFPRLRVFDAYRGHSWASGTAPFADGNNQESSSEAVSAWNGLALWAAASGRPDLGSQARWLLSTEAASARTYWTEPDLEGLDGLRARAFGIVWGAKRDHATWFSAEPNAPLGIQLIPMPPVDGALAADADRVAATVADATPHGFDVQFGDYLLMYLALVDPERARAEAAELDDDVLDGATSRTYLEAWLAAPPERARR